MELRLLSAHPAVSEPRHTKHQGRGAYILQSECVTLPPRSVSLIPKRLVLVDAASVFKTLNRRTACASTHTHTHTHTHSGGFIRNNVAPTPPLCCSYLLPTEHECENDPDMGCDGTKGVRMCFCVWVKWRHRALRAAEYLQR